MRQTRVLPWHQAKAAFEKAGIISNGSVLGSFISFALCLHAPVPAPARRTWSGRGWLALADDPGQRVWAGEDGTGQFVVTGWTGRPAGDKYVVSVQGRCVLPHTPVTPGAAVEIDGH